jgi:hypothetical protein
VRRLCLSTQQCRQSGDVRRYDVVGAGRPAVVWSVVYTCRVQREERKVTRRTPVQAWSITTGRWLQRTGESLY